LITKIIIRNLVVIISAINTLKVVMPDLTRALQGIRHPVSIMDVACASEDTGFRRNDGNSIVLLPVYIVNNPPQQATALYPNTLIP